MNKLREDVEMSKVNVVGREGVVSQVKNEMSDEILGTCTCKDLGP